jgi:hypothetical protein
MKTKYRKRKTTNRKKHSTRKIKKTYSMKGGRWGGVTLPKIENIKKNITMFGGAWGDLIV